MEELKADIAFIGLAVMGQNLILNMDSQGFVVCAFNSKVEKVEYFLATEAKGTKIIGANSLEDMVQKLKKPRKVMISDKAVDGFVKNLVPLLEKGDIIIDGGNSQYTDTQRWCKELAPTGILYIGMGVSGDEDRARYGPSLMPGGHPDAWPAVKPIFQAIGAKIDNVPCCDWVGEDGAGHFIKMVHNAIEYSDMYLINEIFNLMKGVLNLGQDDIVNIFADWNKGEFDSFLINSDILKFKDSDGQYLLNKIRNDAGLRGFEMWTVANSFAHGTPVTLIGEEAIARCLSALKDERGEVVKVLSKSRFIGIKSDFSQDIQKALYASKMISYHQGFMLIREAAKINNWNLNYSSIALMWLGGSIIRSILLEDIKDYFTNDPSPRSLLLDPYFSERLASCQNFLRRIVFQAAFCGIPVPTFSAALAFYDSYRYEVSPPIYRSAQEDYFSDE